MVAGSDQQGIAVIIGATGGIGAALCENLKRSGRFAKVIGLSRHNAPMLDIEDEATIRTAARNVASFGPPTLVIDATGLLHVEDLKPEKSWRDLDSRRLARLFAVNATGPALLMKHFLPLLPKDQRSIFATLSAKVGSISDNRLGGWYGYRASKAALNQFVRSAAIELARTNSRAICVAFHPGTVDTNLSKPFAKNGLDIQTPAEAAAALLNGLDSLSVAESGGFFDRDGKELPW